MDFATIEQAIEDIKNGKMLVVVDDEDRENEGDVIVAAEKLTPEHMNFMATLQAVSGRCQQLLVI